ncbi:HAMP domain-containing sensor histidine kinase [Streptomyces sp. H10-C2]|uniref:sensor histidine kinase n=1 Tax=unclassified Streptomyces TaxID=2593676 RepID=UPI0024B9484C|nr:MULTISPECIES: HAMP domain-containing sensor histidine kinase [unclassified Streptomyces]MDJ0342109.1 HAMP domain-containing sensor histidine kinase [Streptomyces sp. PH10-H1]MDJ0368451.1 HAMP domain-containing sensor histidine kinase [Streptomyces sp. H10-C2]
MTAFRRRPGSLKRPWSLRRRLVVSSVALVAVVCAVIGTVTAIALHTYLYAQLDTQLAAVAHRAAGPPPEANLSQHPRPTSNLGFVIGGGQPLGTIGAKVGDGRITDTAISAQQESGNDGPLVRPEPLTAEETAALSALSLDGAAHSIDIPGLGTYRMQSVATQNGTYLVGIRASGAQDTLNTLVWVEVCVTAAGLAAAGLAGTALIRISLQPLRRVAATASRVSELTLHRGEVALHERVPEGDTDPRTEVGQVGASLNRMLGHVGSALHARQESETRVRQFVADASHELRTPLASIRGYAELTRRGREDIGPDTRHALGRIESEAGRMTTLVEDLLLLARLDAGRPLRLADTDLSPLVVDAVSDARAAGPGHVWRLDLPDEPAAVLGDAERLQQVLANLLANARTHTPPGTTVTARVTRISRTTRDPRVTRVAQAARPGGRQQGDGVLLQVVDDGPGIPPDLQPYIFERFARGDVSRARGSGSGSTGLGLAIVHAVVAAHGGRVWVDSTPGRTAFGVHLQDHPGARLSQQDLRFTTRS